MKEDKRSNFVRLAEKRMNKLIDCFRLIGNLSNTANYEYNEKDLNKIYSEIDKQYKKMKQKFKTAKVNNNKRFLLNNEKEN